MRSEFIDPGALRHEMTLERAEIVPDGLGGHAEAWTEVATILAHMQPVSAVATFDADQTRETVSHRITMRYREDVASGMRLVRGGRVFEVLTVHDPDETKRYLVCRTREKGR